MSDVVEQARRARRTAVERRRAAWIRTALAHERLARAARNLAGSLARVGNEEAAEAQRASAHAHAHAAYGLRRRAATTMERVAEEAARSRARVHLAFIDAETRESVLLLLDDLGPWEGGELHQTPGQPVFYDMDGTDLGLCEIAVRAHLDSALRDFGSHRPFVTVHAVLPVDD